MSTVFKRPVAQSDLAEIWSFIADDSEAQANRFLDVIEHKLQLLAMQPHMGKLRSELMPDLRSFPMGRYVAFYLVTEVGGQSGIDLVRMLHSAMDIGMHDFEESNSH